MKQMHSARPEGSHAIVLFLAYISSLSFVSFFWTGLQGTEDMDEKDLVLVSSACN
jgi:hypothetical protein